VMIDQAMFVNIYIQKMIKEIEELTKTRVLALAKEEFKDLENEELKKKNDELELSIPKEKDEVAQIWKLTLDEKDQECIKLQATIEEINKANLQKQTDYELKISELSGKFEAQRAQLNSLDSQLQHANDAADIQQNEIDKLNDEVKKQADTIAKLSTNSIKGEFSDIRKMEKLQLVESPKKEELKKKMKAILPF